MAGHVTLRFLANLAITPIQADHFVVSPGVLVSHQDFRVTSFDEFVDYLKSIGPVEGV